MFNVQYIILIKKKNFSLLLSKFLAENGFEPLTFGL
jgi:hypothetical protein